MKTRTNTIISSLAVLLALQSPAQDTINHKIDYPSGIFLGYGQGAYAVKDEYISQEKYSGTIPYYTVEWIRFKNKNGYRLAYEYWNSTNISNNNISANAQQFNFNQDFFYPVGNFSLFSKDVYAYLGPSAQLFYYEIYYRFVTPGTFISPTTYGLLGSLGINTEFICHLGNKLKVECFLRSNLVSITHKKIDKDVYANDPSPALLTLFTANRFDFDLSLRYYLLNRISLALGYKFDLSRINKWDPYIAASNNIIVSLNVRI
jgi:hypothetical protein